MADNDTEESPAVAKEDNINEISKTSSSDLEIQDLTIYFSRAQDVRIHQQNEIIQSPGFEPRDHFHRIYFSW